jgi:hypothetical protein
MLKQFVKNIMKTGHVLGESMGHPNQKKPQMSVDNSVAGNKGREFVRSANSMGMKTQVEGNEIIAYPKNFKKK